MVPKTGDCGRRRDEGDGGFVDENAWCCHDDFDDGDDYESQYSEVRVDAVDDDEG